MGVLQLLTIVFVVLKLTGVINWGWIYVLLPTLISISFYLFFCLLTFTITTKRIISHAKYKRNKEKMKRKENKKI